MVKNKTLRMIIWFFFLLYLFALVEVLFLSRTDLWNDNALSLSDYMRRNTNLEPFATIRRFWNMMQNGSLSAGQNDYWREFWLRNIGGNLLLFFPMGFVLPCLIPALARFWKTFLLTALIVSAVEVAQILTRTGSCDVDDLILNLAGSAAGYLLFALIRRLVTRNRKKNVTDGS